MVFYNHSYGKGQPIHAICWLKDTPAHVIEPRFPGAVEKIINLGDFWDETALAANRDNILYTTTAISGTFDRAYRFISAAGSLINDTYRLALDATDTTKIVRYASRAPIVSLSRAGNKPVPKASAF